MALFASLALYCTGHRACKSHAFAVWVFAFVSAAMSAAMAYPGAFM